MHIVVRESRDLDEAAAPQDLGLAPADIVFLSFSDSDLAMAAAAFRSVAEDERPSLRIANLNALRHPMSVDLFAETTLKGTKAVLVRLLGGLDYWRYGGEQLGTRCRELGIALAIVPGDGRPTFGLRLYRRCMRKIWRGSKGFLMLVVSRIRVWRCGVVGACRRGARANS